MENNRSYRIRTTVGRKESYKIDVPLSQTYDVLEVLSLKLQQKNEYNFYDSDYGIVVGRVVVNGGVGLPNAKISVFIESDGSGDLNSRLLYNFSATNDTDADGVRYNLLPDFVDNACHQDVGTFPNKRLVLDNKDMLEVFDKYYKYTTVTNESGDFMLFGIPTGSCTLHADCDLSDIGQLSQRPRDMVYKGYNINQFESPNKFKQSTNLNSLSQIYSQDKGVFVYPYWGNRGNGDNGNVAITRCDIEIEYKIEPTCVFIGSVVTDKGSNAIGKNCTGTDNVGKMSDLAAGEGSIEMIRKTVDGKVEEFQIKGNRLIDGDGVWCYQIPMNLDYVTTDEFGNIVPTDDPSKGIPTRARVRFRISLDENPNDASARKRCKFLVPNNPRYDKVDYPGFYQTKEADYEFGSATRDEDYCDLFWNNVYTVKSYIPRLQKNRNTTNRKHTGIKLINHYGDNNPMPYNSLSIKLSFTYRLICVLVKMLIWIIATINTILALIMEPLCQLAEIFLWISKKLCFKILGMKPLCFLGAPFKLIGNLLKSMIVKGITLGSSFCDDSINRIAFYPILMKISPCVLDKIKDDFNKEQNKKTNPEERERLEVITITSMDNNELITCIENNLAQSNDATSFNFQNDWVNGVLYAPLWYRKITPKKSFLFGLFKRKAKDQWCRADGNFNLMVYQACVPDKAVSEKGITSPVNGKKYPLVTGFNGDCKYGCHDKRTTVNVDNGLILTRQTMLGQTVYYYRAVEYNQQLANDNDGDGVILLFATDIVLLGSLNDCDMNGIPQFFKNLESTTYNMPTDILFTDTIIQVDAKGDVVVNPNNDIVYEQFTEATGCDWGNLNEFDECGKMGKDEDGGLFYGIGCSSNEMTLKSCLNLSRVCEFGVSLDDAKEIADLGKIEGDENAFERLTPDGFISFDELYNINERSMFATLNGNRLRTRLNNKNGLKEYDLRYLYTDNFDGLAETLMRHGDKDCNYSGNYNLERMSKDYYMFRMGTEPFFYDSNNSLARYENSFYFYFGLKMGKTAIDKFNSQFFATCEDTEGIVSPISVEVKPNSWCTDGTVKADGYVMVDLTNVTKPYDIVLNSLDQSYLGFEKKGLKDDYILFGIKGKINTEGFTEEKKEKFETYHDYNLNSEDDWIPNGEYELTVTDADGQIVPYKFSMKNKKLQFSYEKVDNEIPNNQRIDENKDGYAQLFNKINTFESIKEYGGYVKIASIIDNFDDSPDKCYLLNYNFVNKKLSKEKIQFMQGYEGVVKLTVNKGKINDYENINKNDNIDEIRFIDNELYILTPLGDVDYEVTITELCDCSKPTDDTSKNSSKLTIRVNDTLPFKLFVNDIDVATFKDIKKSSSKWGIGWDDSVKNPDINNLGRAWVNLVPDNFDNYYDITKIEGYDEVKDNKEKVEELKKDFLNSIKETFWLTSDTQPKNIVITVQTNKFPVKYYLFYNAEESGEKSGVNALENGSNDFAVIPSDLGTYAVNDILMPTITNSDNENYGYDDSVNSISNGTISFGYDRQNGYDEEKGKYIDDKKHVKKPYGIRIVNSKGDKLPVVGNVQNNFSGDTAEGSLDNDNKDKGNEYYFFFHIIDKILKFKMTAWSYVNNIPYPPGGVPDNEGKYIKMVGLVDGEIHNGILPFTTFELGNKKVTEFKTVDDENAIPTKRYINEVLDRTYNGYAVGGDVQENYMPVPNTQDTLTIEDTSAFVSETIYGNMSIKLSSNDKDGNFQFTINNGDNDGDTKLVFIDSNGESDYPLKNASYEDGKWSAMVNGTIMKYDVKLEDLYGMSGGKVDKVWIMDEEEGDYKETGFGNGDGQSQYTENGNFKLKSLKEGDKFYVVAVTGNNCRALSPLYDYADITAEIFLANVITKLPAPPAPALAAEGGEGNTPSPPTYEEKTEKKIGVLLYKTPLKDKDIKSLPYYLEYYEYAIRLIIDSIPLKMDETVNVNPNGYCAFFDNADLYEKNFVAIKNKIGLQIKDCTNLSLTGKFKSTKDSKDVFSVVYETENLESPEDTIVEYVLNEKGINTIKLLTAKAKEGYNFEGWSSDGGATIIKEDTYTVTGCVVLTPVVTPIELEQPPTT